MFLSCHMPVAMPPLPVHTLLAPVINRLRPLRLIIQHIVLTVHVPTQRRRVTSPHKCRVYEYAAMQAANATCELTYMAATSRRTSGHTASKPQSAPSTRRW